MHLGATLRLLRLGNGMSVRELAARLGVSGAYLSRVENGVDPVPTVPRLCAIARELQVPEQLLLDTAHLLSPYVLRYAEAEPQAASLYLEIARRELGPRELQEVKKFLERRFPIAAAASAPREAEVALAPLLAPPRVVLDFVGTDFRDVLEIGGGRFAVPEGGEARAGQEFLRSAETIPSAVGAGLAVPYAHLAGAPRQAALITLKRAIPFDTPDGIPLSAVVLLLGPGPEPAQLRSIAHVARLAARGLANALRGARQEDEAIFRVEELERIR